MKSPSRTGRPDRVRSEPMRWWSGFACERASWDPHFHSDTHTCLGIRTQSDQEVQRIGSAPGKGRERVSNVSFTLPFITAFIVFRAKRVERLYSTYMCLLRRAFLLVPFLLLGACLLGAEVTAEGDDLFFPKGGDIGHFSICRGVAGRTDAVRHGI